LLSALCEKPHVMSTWVLSQLHAPFILPGLSIREGGGKDAVKAHSLRTSLSGLLRHRDHACSYDSYGSMRSYLLHDEHCNARPLVVPVGPARVALDGVFDYYIS
jgi:hypothetical protein